MQGSPSRHIWMDASGWSPIARSIEQSSGCAWVHSIRPICPRESCVRGTALDSSCASELIIRFVISVQESKLDFRVWIIIQLRTIRNNGVEESRFLAQRGDFVPESLGIEYMFNRLKGHAVTGTPDGEHDFATESDKLRCVPSDAIEERGCEFAVARV